MTITVGVTASHVHNLSTCEGAWVTNMFQRGLEYVTALFLALKPIESGHTGSIDSYIDMDLEFSKDVFS